jgi:hypothetical protein
MRLNIRLNLKARDLLIAKSFAYKLGSNVPTPKEIHETASHKRFSAKPINYSPCKTTQQPFAWCHAGGNGDGIGGSFWLGRVG